MLRAVLMLFLLSVSAASQVETGPAERHPSTFGAPLDPKLPNGKSQNEAIVKQDHEHDLKDAAQLAGLAKAFEDELQKQDSHVLSVSMLKKLDEIDKLARRIQSRMKRY